VRLPGRSRYDGSWLALDLRRMIEKMVARCAQAAIIRETRALDEDVLAALRGVNDPEIGINIVDLGLVYEAERKPEGIDVKLTLSTPSCPMSEMLVEEAREALQARFADARSINVELVWDPPWTPDRMSEAARRQFGW
jgi:metal-sulfur cluster biosynthetic enzyme